MPKVSQEVFRVRSHSATMAQAQKAAEQLTLEGQAENIRCPLLVVRRRRSPDSAVRRRAAGERRARAFGIRAVSGRQSRVFQHQLQIPPADGGLDGGSAAALMEWLPETTERLLPAVIGFKYQTAKAPPPVLFERRRVRL
jgi:hypothetical protein